MELYERDFLLHRIIAGKLRCKYENEVYIIVPPDDDLKYEAQEIYYDMFIESKEKEIFTHDEMVDFMIEKGMWSLDEEDEMSSEIPKAIEDCKVELYKAVYNTPRRIEMREHIERGKKRFDELINKRNTLFQYTCEGISSFAKSMFLIENTTYKENKKCNWADIGSDEILIQINQSHIDDDAIRELARTAPWTNIWPVKKKSGNIFGKNTNHDQERLLNWSILYDNIHESPDCPHDSILQDDDMLDGWLILQRREREEEKKKKQGSEVVGNKKISQADEIFVPAQTKEDANRINDLNDNWAKRIKRQRMKIVEKHGEVNYKQFPDIQQKDQIRAAQVMRDNMTRGK